MNPDWKTHLSAAGAIFDNERVIHFGNPVGELAGGADGMIADLSHFGLIGLVGDDAQTFLQGQTTNDVRQVSDSQAQPGAICTHQGRMLTTYVMWRSGGEYFMEIPPGLREGVQKRLTMYVLRSKVKVRDAGADVVRFGVAGAAAQAALRSACGGLPEAQWGVLAVDGATVLALPGGRYEIAASAARAADLWKTLSATCRPVGAACWEWATIRAGMPVLTAATLEQFTPQMTNLELLGGVSFTKGCYTGQEVVARTQHLGKVKRRLYLAHIDGDTAPVSGDALSGTDHGTVINAAPAPGGGVDLLAVISCDDREKSTLRCGGESGAQLHFPDMPYAVS